jgi:hypothetical protein
MCSNNSPGYILRLPIVSDDTKTWSAVKTTWFITTQMLATNWPTYPLATVLEIPIDTPSHVKFIIDGSQDSDEIGLNFGLQSLQILLNDLNLQSSNKNDYFTKDTLNVTGKYPPTFVIKNLSDHDVFFTKNSLDKTYWTLQSQTTTLLYPPNEYSQINKEWNASPLPEFQNDFYAFSAESLMFKRLNK